MKQTLTELTALAVALTLFGTGPALTFSSNHDRSHQVRLQIPKQVQKAVKPKSIKSKAVKSKTFKLKAVTTTDTNKKKKNKSASTTKHSLANTVTKPQKTKIPAIRTRTRKAIATIPEHTLKSRKRTTPPATAKAKQQKLKDQSKVADGGPQPEPPTTPRRNLLPPKLDRTGKSRNGRLDDFDDFREAADAMRDLNHLRDAANRDQWGQEQESWPENGHGLPGGDLNGRAGDNLPSSAKPLETEGAPDFATYFNDAIPRPGGSGGQTAPDDGGPQRGYWRPSHDGASGPRGPGAVKDPRGLASDGDTFTGDGLAGSRTVTNEDGSSTDTAYGADGSMIWARTDHEDGSITTTVPGEDGEVNVYHRDEKGRLTRREHYQDGIKVSETIYSRRDGNYSVLRRNIGTTWVIERYTKDGFGYSTLRPRSDNPNPTDDHASDWEMLDWARAGRTTWMLAPSDRRTLPEKTDEMVSQPGREGAGGGARRAGPSLGQDAVTNNGDSSFNVAPVRPLGYGRAPSGGVVGGCITCDSQTRARVSLAKKPEPRPSAGLFFSRAPAPPNRRRKSARTRAPPAPPRLRSDDVCRGRGSPSKRWNRVSTLTKVASAARIRPTRSRKRGSSTAAKLRTTIMSPARNTEKRSS